MARNYVNYLTTASATPKLQ